MLRRASLCPPSAPHKDCGRDVQSLARIAHLTLTASLRSDAHAGLAHARALFGGLPMPDWFDYVWWAAIIGEVALLAVWPASRFPSTRGDAQHDGQ